MITLSASGGSVTFTFSGNSTYLNDGTITVPVNSLALIIDESDMISFKKANSNDLFVSANIAEFGMTKAELESWFKENAVGSTGGGGDITSGEVQTMIDESISGKADSSAVTEEISAAVSGKADTTAVTAAIAAATSGKVDTTTYTAYTASTDAALSGKVDYIVSVPSSSTEVIVTSNDTANIVGYDYIIVPSDMYALTYKHGSSVSPIGYINNGVLTLQSGFTTTGQDEPINVGADDKFTIPISLINTNIVKEVNSWGEYTFVLVKSASTIDVVEQLEKVDEKVNTSDFDTYAESTTSAINSKVGKSTFNSHTGNTNIHVTSSEKQNWNNKLAASAVTSAITGNDTNPVAAGAVYDKVHVTSGNGSTTVLTFDGNGTATNYPSGNTKVRLYAGAYNIFEVKFLTSNKCFYWRAQYNSEGWTFDASLSALYCDGPSFTATTSYTDNVLTVEVTNVSTGVPSDIIGLEFWDGFVPSQLAKMEAVEGETAEYWIKDYVDVKVAESISGKVDTEDLDISGKTLYVGDYHSGGMPYELTKEYPISTKPTKLLVKRTDDGDATNVTAFQLYFDNGTTSGSCILRVSTAVGSGITEAAWQVETPEASLELVNGEVYITFLNGYYLTMFKPASYIQGFVMQIVTDVESGSTPSVVESGIYDALNKMSETLTDVITKSDAAYYRGIGYPSLSYSSLSGITFSSSAVGVGVGINTATTSTLATDASIDANNGVLGVYTTGATHTVIKNDSDIIDRISINSIPSNIKMYWNSSYTGNTSHYIAVSCTVNDGTNGYCRWDWNNGQYVPNVNYVNTAVTLSYDSTNQVVTITPSSSSALTSIIYVRCNRNIAPSSALTQDNCKIGLVTIDSNSYKLQEALDNKQDILSAGTNITISGNVISATGGGSSNLPISAGTGTNSIIVGSYFNEASGGYSVAQGEWTKASGGTSHAEGSRTKTYGSYSHAEGSYSEASGSYSHAEGDSTYATAQASHSEGQGTSATSMASHSEGRYTQANGMGSHSEGYYTIAENEYEHASGKFNASNTGEETSAQTLFSVGNGGWDETLQENVRHNAFEIRKNGDIYLSSGGTDIKLQDYLGGGGGTVSSAITSGDTNPVQGGVLYNELRIVDNISQRTQLIWSDAGDGVYCFNLPSNCYKIEFVGGNENAEVNITINATKAFVALWSGNTWTVSSISQGLTTIIDGSKLTLISTDAFDSIESAYYSWSYQTTSYAIVESSSVTPLIDKVKEDEQVTAAALNELNARIAALEAIIQNMNN